MKLLTKLTSSVSNSPHSYGAKSNYGDDYRKNESVNNNKVFANFAYTEDFLI